jgi:methylase of polypeptide subunit release factors
MFTLDYKKIDQKFQMYTRELDTENLSYIYGEVDYQCIDKILKQLSILQNGGTFIDIGSGCGKLIVGLSKEVFLKKIYLQV